MNSIAKYFSSAYLFDQIIVPLSSSYLEDFLSVGFFYQYP